MQNSMKDSGGGKRRVLFIDGSHLDRLRSKLGRPLDLERLRDEFSSQNEPVKAYYYRDARDVDEYHRLQRFFDWLERHGRSCNACVQPSGSCQYRAAAAPDRSG
ncbi:NYN domain-containing protein [Pseudotabrizicola alkalilacus]|uniref:NYN domain-containing protein n=1 Tax=Pseudotabrizicola alkalilacus TaxID=2305252 RepID=A0A411Z1X5_9RHOB|nr:NYN domain-containing protein [Pseudotabrizicola alkalilacus]